MKGDKECSCGCGETDKDEDFFTCNNCFEEDLHEGHFEECNYCDEGMCRGCLDDHLEECINKRVEFIIDRWRYLQYQKRKRAVRFIIDRWRYLWYYQLDHDGVSKFCKYSCQQFISS